MRIAIISIVIIVAVIGTVLLVRSCGGDSPDAGLTELADTPAPQTELSGGSSSAAPGPNGRLVDVGGHGLFIRTWGEGSPAVVIEPGIGDAGLVWQGVIDALSGETQVALYDRAGYGRSDAGPLPRSADRVVAELTRLLPAAPVEHPYVIVGHSLGAMHALLYASEHPNLVAGVVLLDPPPIGFIKGERFPELGEMAEQMTAASRREAEAARTAGNEREAARLEAVASEHEQMFETGWSWMASVRTLGDTPLVVVASGVPNPEFGASASEFQRYWRSESEALSALSTRGRFVFVEDSTHNLPGEATDEVVDAILWCIAASKDLPEYEVYQGEK